MQPGATAGDVLRELGLEGYLLSREGSAQAFANEENLYAAVDDGTKIRATPIAEVGFIDELLVILGFRSRVVLKQPDKEKIGPAAAVPSRQINSAIRDRTAGRTRIRPDGRQLWQVRGWRQEGTKLIGAFRTPRGSFAGEISLANRLQPEFFIRNPPPAILRGSHGACFRSRGGDKYFVHFGKASPEIDAGIVAIEKLVAGALAGKA